MLYDLLRLDLRGWSPKKIYETQALVEQKQNTLRGLNAWIEAVLQEGRLPVPLSDKYPNRCLSDNLEKAAKEFDPYTNKSQIAKKLQELFGTGEGGLKEFNVQIARGWAFPPLPECRAAWERRYGGRWVWHHAAKQWQGLRPPIDLDRMVM